MDFSKIINVLLVLGLLILIPMELKAPIVKAELLPPLSDTSTSGYLALQSNSLLPISPVDAGGPKKIIKIVTAYYPAPSETDSDPCIAASGLNICSTSENICACPRKYPFGTKFLIGNKIYSCQDRLSKKYDDRIDLLMSSKEEVLKWGKRKLEVTVLN